MKNIQFIAQTYSHVYTNVGTFIWISVWSVSFYWRDPSSFKNSIQFVTKLVAFSFKQI